MLSSNFLQHTLFGGIFGLACPCCKPNRREFRTFADDVADLAAIGATGSHLSALQNAAAVPENNQQLDGQDPGCLPRDALLAIIQHLSRTDRQQFRLVGSRWAAICIEALDQGSIVAYLDADLSTWERQVAFYSRLGPFIQRLVLVSTKPKEQLREQLAILAQGCAQLTSLTIHHVVEPSFLQRAEPRLRDIYTISHLTDLQATGLWPVAPSKTDEGAITRDVVESSPEPRANVLPRPATQYWLDGLQPGVHANKGGETVHELDNVARHIALLIRHSSDLSFATKGILLSWSCQSPLDSKVLFQFMQTFNFTGLFIVEAMRQLLATFRLPGEAGRINKIIEQFAARYYAQNPTCGLADGDAVYVLAYAVIMLNTDQHNRQVRVKMTVEQFKRNLAGANGGQDMPDQLLMRIFQDISRKQIMIRGS